MLPFQTVRSGLVGRIVRLGPLVDRILSRHDYPDGVSHILGQAIALSALLGTALKFDGNLIVQTKTDGPLGFLVVNFETPGNLRGYAGFEREQAAQLEKTEQRHQGAILGKGHLAITIDPTNDMDRYQGIVALDNQPLVEAAGSYFRQSEQLPTFIRLAVARHFMAGAQGGKGCWQWRAGGLLLQHIATEGGIKSERNDTASANLQEDFAQREDLATATASDKDEDDHWTRGRYLAQTVEDHELLDPSLTPERLLYRLFHEEGVRVGAPRPLQQFCRCSRARIRDMLHNFGSEERADMRDDTGKLVVTCEFCATSYKFDDVEIS